MAQAEEDSDSDDDGESETAPRKAGKTVARRVRFQSPAAPPKQRRRFRNDPNSEESEDASDELWVARGNVSHSENIRIFLHTHLLYRTAATGASRGRRPSVSHSGVHKGQPPPARLVPDIKRPATLPEYGGPKSLPCSGPWALRRHPVRGKSAMHHIYHDIPNNLIAEVIDVPAQPAGDAPEMQAGGSPDQEEGDVPQSVEGTSELTYFMSL